MKAILFLIILSVFTDNAWAQHKTLSTHNIIGRVYRKIDEISEFAGYKEQEGVLIGFTDGHFGLSEIANNNKTIIIFEKVLPPSKIVNYKLLDTIVIGKLNHEKIIIMSSCKLNKKYDEEIIALVRYQAKEYYNTVLKAWRANRTTGKFEKLPARGIVCVDHNYTSEK